MNNMPKINSHKCLPCKTYIMCGHCPYYNRCRYIHDPRIKYSSIHGYRLNNKKYIDEDEDLWFWPYSYTYPYYNIDNKNTAIYSLWNNLIDVCENQPTYRYEKINKYTNRARLPIFIKICS